MIIIFQKHINTKSYLIYEVNKLYNNTINNYKNIDIFIHNKDEEICKLVFNKNLSKIIFF